MNVSMSLADRLRRMVSTAVFTLGILVLWLTPACNVDSVFELDCPGLTIVGDRARIGITLTSDDSYFTFTIEDTEPEDTDFVIEQLPLDPDNSNGGIDFQSEIPASAVVVVTEIASDGIQKGTPLECAIEFVDASAIDCDGPFAQEGIGNFCEFDADCNQCQVCLRASSVPSSTCAVRIPCESSLDCQAASVDSQGAFDVNFCEDDGFCR